MIRPGPLRGRLVPPALLLAAVLAAGNVPAAEPPGIRWTGSYTHALEEARTEQKYIMVDLFTTWCHWCRVLDQKTYRDGRVVALTDRMVNVKVNAEVEVEIAARFGVRSYPTILFLNPDGSLRHRVRGYSGPDAFVPILEEVLAGESELRGMGEQIASAPADHRLRFEYATVLARNRRDTEAVAQLDTLLQAKSLPSELAADARLDRAAAQVRSGQEAGRARQELERWLRDFREHPRSVEARYILGLARLGEGKAKEARRIFEQLARDAPDSWFAASSRFRLRELAETSPGPKGT